eukprot:jgi/Tetstr1/464735/TSEL_009482.t1
MMPGPESQILSYHVLGTSAFLPNVDHEDEAVASTRTTRDSENHDGGETRHWNPEAHIGDDEYILTDVKASVAEATAGKTGERKMRRVERINSKGNQCPNVDSQVCKEAWIVFIRKVSFLRLRRIARSRLPTDCTDWPTKLMRFHIEFFPLTTKSTCFIVGNLAQTLRHFGFPETAANKIASALDMVPTKVFSHTIASGFRKLLVRALPDPVNEHAYADRKRALQDSNGSQGA